MINNLFFLFVIKYVLSYSIDETDMIDCYIFSSDVNLDSYLNYYFVNQSNDFEFISFHEKYNKTDYPRCTFSDNENPILFIDSIDDFNILFNYLDTENNTNLNILKNVVTLYTKSLEENYVSSEFKKYLCFLFFKDKIDYYFNYQIINSTIDKKIRESILNLVCDAIEYGLSFIAKTNNRTSLEDIPLKIKYNKTTSPIRSYLMESVRSAHILKMNKKKIRDDYKSWVYESNFNISYNTSKLKFYSYNFIKSSILAYKGIHPLHNNVFKYTFNRAYKRTYNYYTNEAFSGRTKPLKKLFIDFKNIVSKAMRHYKSSEIRYNYYNKNEFSGINRIIEEPKILFALDSNDTVNLTLGFTGLNDTEGFLDLTIYFTLSAWLPIFSIWKGHNKSKNESNFRPEIPADYISKLLFNLNCIRRTDLMRDLFPSLYIPPNPYIGLMPCFWLPDPRNYNETSTTQFQLIKSLIPKKYKDSVRDLTICSEVSGFFFFYDSLFLPLRIMLSIIFQPLLCVFGQMGEPFYSLIRLLVVQPDKCSLDYLSYMPNILCSIIYFISFGILAIIFIIPFFLICITKCCSDCYKFLKFSELENNKQKLEDIETEIFDIKKDIIFEED
jgi:hypothetical protein